MITFTNDLIEITKKIKNKHIYQVTEEAKVPKSLGTRRATVKSQTNLTITDLFYSPILNINRGSINSVQEVSGVYTSLSLDSD